MNNTCKALMVTSALFAGNLQAEIVLNGFASVVAGVTTSSDEQLYDYSDSIDFKAGSLFALQISSDLADGLGVTTQMVSRGSEDWAVDFEWAYISYDATDDLRFLVGRQRAPFYMYSDFLDVSYAYPWITPPEGVYDLTFDTFDGIGAIYTTTLGEFDTSFQLIYGRNNDELTITNPLDATEEQVAADFQNLFGGSITLNREWLTLRAGVIQTDITVPYSILLTLSDNWQQTGFSDIASNVLTEDDSAVFIELGFQVDFEQLIVVGEYTQLTLDDTTFADEESYYVMAGWRFDNMMLHITYGAGKDSSDDITTGVPTGVGLDELIGYTQIVTTAQNDKQTYYTLGLRWDFHDSAALKFEYTNFSDDLNSANDAGLFRTALVTVF